jgi:hypothetical protein
MMMQPVSPPPGSFHCFHLLFCFLGNHFLFLPRELWNSANGDCPFVIYRLKNLWNLTGCLEKKFNERKMSGVTLRILAVLWLWSLFRQQKDRAVALEAGVG